MRDPVRAAFVSYSKPLESCLNKPYLDVKKLATVGIGDLEEPLSEFQKLPFTRGPGGPPASVPEIQNGYWILKHSTLDPRKGGVQYEALTDLWLSDEAITMIVSKKLAEIETVLITLIPEWSTFGCDAQLGILSMAWALGAYFPRKWPKFTAAARAGKWDVCAIECQPSAAEMAAQNDSFHKRVSSWIQLFKNAAVAVDPNVLQFQVQVAA